MKFRDIKTKDDLIQYVHQRGRLTKPVEKIIDKKYNWDIDLVKNISEHILWKDIVYKYKFTEEFLETFKMYFNTPCWILLSKHQKLTEKFMRNNFSNLNRWWVCESQELSESFIDDYCYELLWEPISRFQKLSEILIRKYSNKVHWFFISQCQTMSEDFIREFQDEVVWSLISEYQVLSEPFIDEFKHKVNWYRISKNQVLSEPFIKKHKKSVSIKNILKNEKCYKLLSDNFYIENFHFISSNILNKYKRFMSKDAYNMIRELFEVQR